MTIDWDVALGFADGRQELLLELIGVFFTEHAELMPYIAKAIENGDAGALHLFSHRLKGCLRYFGESKAADAAWQLELLGRGKMLDGAPGLLIELRAAIDELLPEIRAYQHEHEQP